jgi:arginine:ornithine antiporter/lysine permease
MIYAGGTKFLLLSALLYAPGSLLFVLARREQGKAVFTTAEALLFGAVVVAALIGVYGLASGSISI